MMSLRIWLALALALIVAVPALAFAGAWAAAGSWQAGREQARYRQALALLRTAPPAMPGERKEVAARLTALGIEGKLAVGRFPSDDKRAEKLAAAAGTAIVTGTVAGAVGPKQKLQQGYRPEEVELADVRGTLLVRRETARCGPSSPRPPERWCSASCWRSP